MPPLSEKDTLLLLQRLRPRLLRWTRIWLRRTGYAPGTDAAQLLADWQGALWLEIRDLEDPEQDWTRAIRRVLYREIERPLLVRTKTLPDTLQVPRSAESVPINLLIRIREFSAHPGHPLDVARAHGWTRRILKSEITALFQQMSGPRFFEDLRHRIARLHIRATSDAPRAKVLAETSALLRVTGLLDLPDDLRQARRGLTNLLARKEAIGPGNQECATCFEPPRAKESPAQA